MTDAPKRYRYKHTFTIKEKHEVVIDLECSDSRVFGVTHAMFERDYEEVEPRSIIGKSFTVVNNSSTAKAIISGTEVRIEDEEPVEQAAEPQE